MKITPRAQEYTRIAEILESGDYDGPKDMARAILREAANILAMRDTYVVAHTWLDGKRGLNYGVFGSEGEAKKFAERLGGVGGTAHVVSVASAEALVANQDGKKSWTPWCVDPECGHAPFTHSAEAAARGACQVPTCKCNGYRK